MAIVEALEIDLVKIDVRPDVLEHRGRAVAVRDEAVTSPASRASLKTATAHSA
jgi:hypothetical protein